MELILESHSLQKIGENSEQGVLKQKSCTKKNQLVFFHMYGFWGRGIDWNHLFLFNINAYARKDTTPPQSGSAKIRTKAGIYQSFYLQKLGTLVMFFLNFRRPEGDCPQLIKAATPTQSGSANTRTRAGIYQS